MSMITGGCFGQNRILLAMSEAPCLLICERDRRRHAGLVADLPRGVALARRVFDQARVAGTEEVLAAVAAADLELAGEDDHELPPRRGMPVVEPADVPFAERDLGGWNALHPVVVLLVVDLLDV